MIEFGISVVLIVLLIAAVVFFKKRKKCSSCCPSKQPPKSESKAPEQVKQQQETKLTDKPVANAEPISVNSQITEATVVTPEPKPETNQPAAQPSAKPQTQETTVSSSENTLGCPLLPQDSVLKRHYLTHVCAMIESLAPPRPTDSVLCRHYDSVIAAEIGLCLSDKKAMEQLIHDYENNK